MRISCCIVSQFTQVSTMENVEQRLTNLAEEVAELRNFIVDSKQHIRDIWTIVNNVAKTIEEHEKLFILGQQINDALKVYIESQEGFLTSTSVRMDIFEERVKEIEARFSMEMESPEDITESNPDDPKSIILF